jgi:hypothetical protein
MRAPSKVEVVHGAHERREVGRGIVFELPKERLSPREILTRLDGKSVRLVGQRAIEALLERIEECAASLPYPGAVPVDPRAEPDDLVSEDLLVAVTVISKSSGHLYLRGKEPNLSRLKPHARVVLVFSDDWRPS